MIDRWNIVRICYSRNVTLVLIFALTCEILRPARCVWIRQICSASASTRDSRLRGSTVSSRSDQAVRTVPSSWNGETQIPLAWATWGCAPVGARPGTGNFILNIIPWSLAVKENVMHSPSTSNVRDRCQCQEAPLQFLRLTDGIDRRSRANINVLACLRRV